MPELPDKAHPILGIIVTILVIINVRYQPVAHNLQYCWLTAGVNCDDDTVCVE